MRRQRRGFVLLMAIALLGLVAAALALLATIAVSRVKRGQIDAADTQVRQLLLVAEAYARSHADELAHAPTTQTVALPPQLSGASLTLMSAPGAGTLTVQTQATTGGRHASQQLVYSHTDRWTLQSATLSD